MAKNVTLMGANYPGVPAVVLPQTGGGNAVFLEADDVESALAIVVDGDNAPRAISSGQYLFIKNHSTLATGGYHATADIASGGAVSGSNVTADPDGIANTIRREMGTVPSGKTLQGEITELTPSNVSITINTTSWTNNKTKAFKIKDLVFVNVYVTGTATANATICTGLPKPAEVVYLYGVGAIVSVNTNGICYVSSVGSGGITGGTLVYRSA